MADRIEIWEWEGRSMYQEAIIFESGRAIVPENTMAMLLREAGYEKVKEFIYE